MDYLNEETKKNGKFQSRNMLKIIIGIIIPIIIFYYLFSAPANNKDVIIHISNNDSLTKISKELESENVIRHPLLFKLLLGTIFGDKHIRKGDYLFKKNSSVLEVSWQLSKSKYGVEPIKITFKEGITIKEMAQLLADKIPNFNKDSFLNDSRAKEGYLFPDTYFFFPLSTTNEILDDMSLNFKRKIATQDKDIKSSGKSLSDIITMASILEKEAKGKEDIDIISGILWKRIKLGMPLQVDVALITYKKSGLPEEPISNPGLLAIRSAISPVETPYLFYLHDNDGVVHYAVDFSQHRSNIAKYLK